MGVLVVSNCPHSNTLSGRVSFHVSYITSQNLLRERELSREKRSGVDTGWPELKRCLEYLREGDTLLVTEIDRLARSTSDLYRIISELTDKGVAFKVVESDDRHH
jgi:DNA invertase Pin-like site-specific DNA recombinase